MFVARVLAVFNKDERKIRKKAKIAKQQEKIHASEQSDKSDKD